MEKYQLVDIETYLNHPYHIDLPQEIKDEIRRVRTTFEHVDWLIYKELVKIGVIKRQIKLRKPRSLFTDGNEIVYYNSWTQEFQVVGNFVNEE